MKTQTRTQIIKIIEERGKTRPVDLCRLLGISAQALHRHLRALIEQRVLEVRGSAPFTQYALAGVPDFEAALAWVNDSSPPQEENETRLCETRDALTARLPRLKSFLQAGLSPAVLPLVISTAGEIGNNSFDHNLGQWKDTPGCWFEAQATGPYLWVCIADRGQGVFRSLSRVYPELTDEQSALDAAFEKIISGRAPERRGNGLKFVRSSLSESRGRGLACMSGLGRVHYGELGESCASILKRHIARARGTITLMVWSIG
jgi:hypothetical protein